MDTNNKSLDYLPSSLSGSLMAYDPVQVTAPRKIRLESTHFDVKIRYFPKQHPLERSFRPYLRARDHVNAIKSLPHRHNYSDFDVAVESQKRFLHEYPRNLDYKRSRMPEHDYFKRERMKIDRKPFIYKREKVQKTRLPQIFDHFYHKFNMHFSDLSIYNTNKNN